MTMNKMAPVWDEMFKGVILDCRRIIPEYLIVDEEIRIDPSFINGFLMYREHGLIEGDFNEEDDCF